MPTKFKQLPLVSSVADGDALVGHPADEVGELRITIANLRESLRDDSLGKGGIAKLDGLWLRNNEGALEQSIDGGLTWKAFFSGDIDQVFSNYVDATPGALTQLQALEDGLASDGDLTTKIINVLAQLTVADETVTSRNALSGAATAGTQASTFSGWGADFTVPSGSFNYVNIPAIGRAPGITVASEKWSKIKIELRDGPLISGTVVATGEVDVDPEADTLSNLSIAIKDLNGDRVMLDSSNFPSGTVGIGYLAVNSSGDDARSGGNLGTMNNFANESYYATNSTNGFNWADNSGDTPMAFRFDHIKVDYSYRDDVESVAALQAELKDLLGSMTEVVGFDAINYLSSGPTPSPRGATFAGWGNDMNVIAGESFDTVKLGSIARSTPASDAEKWSKIHVIVRDGSLSGTGTNLAFGEINVDPELDTLPELHIRLVDANGDYVTIADTNFSGSVFGVGWYATNADGGRAISGETRGTPSNYEGNSYYTTTDTPATLEQPWADYSGDLALAILLGKWNSRTYKSLPILDITLPPHGYALEGKESALYFQNIHPGEERSLTWDATAPSGYGEHQEERWAITPDNAQAVAGWSLGLIAKDPVSPNTILESLTLPYRTAVASAGSGVTRKFLGIGDSTMANSVMLTELESLFDADVMGLDLIGTQGSADVTHEGHSGKTASWFAGSSSPFWDGSAIDIADYMTSNSLSMAADDWVFINLGINDAFGQTSDAGAKAIGETAVSHYQTLITAFKAYQAGLRFALALPIPPCSKQSAMGNNYGPGQNTLRQKANMLQFAKAILEEFGDSEASNIFIVPINVNLDTVWNFPHVTEGPNSRNTADQITRWTNGVHPSSEGYHQIADSLHAFLKFHA